MGEPAFALIGDDISQPEFARTIARDGSFGGEKLEDAFKRPGASLGEPISMRDFFPGRGIDATLEDGASFPDDSFLLMIGNTEELVKAYKEAEDAHILAIFTKTRRPLGLRYARIEVSRISGQVDTLIAIGPQQLLPSHSQDAWHEYQGWQTSPTYVATLDGEPVTLTPITRSIKANDGKPWI